MSEIESAAWSAEQLALWERIARHPFERPEIALDFAGRLAADMGWRRGFALGAIEEYRRFCFLAMTGRMPATPSEEVDAVWHLHLTYSRDYWDVWCAGVLRGPLHHQPTAGGAAEGGRFREQYAGTLARYERRFGLPDPRFWPGTRERFRVSPRYRMVDTEQVLVIPRPRFALPWRIAAVLAPLALILVPHPAEAQTGNPLDLNGAAFLWLYLKVAVGTLLLSILLGPLTRLVLQALSPDGEPGTLNTLELAYVAGGADRAADLVALTLLSSGAASVESLEQRIVIDAADAALPPEIRPFLDCAAGPTPRGAFAKAVKSRLGPMARRLVARGLVPDPRLGALLSAIMLSPVAAALAFGLAKLVVGLSRDRPVGLLILAMLLLAFAAFMLHRRRPVLRTRAGARALAHSRTRHARAARAPLPAELPLAFALAGIAALEAADPAQAAYLRYMKSSGAGGSGGGDGGGSGCGSGSGGSGCGGCGGGGD
ncbi:TIGR04222 domain-containing membrane protein [Methylobacterium sp. sgz302541]|uniref:TIGR04222 domain-containing membrane protein n=1 Tax=unclassified Methylobacterium TaxID=2615210 RepID=UPI003D328DCD